MDHFSGNKNLEFFADTEGSTFSHCVALTDSRNEWVERYFKKGIQLGILIEYSVPYMKAYIKYAKSDYLISKKYSKTTINFPISKAIKNQGTLNASR